MQNRSERRDYGSRDQDRQRYNDRYEGRSNDNRYYSEYDRGFEDDDDLRRSSQRYRNDDEDVDERSDFSRAYNYGRNDYSRNDFDRHRSDYDRNDYDHNNYSRFSDDRNETSDRYDSQWRSERQNQYGRDHHSDDRNRSRNNPESADNLARMTSRNYGRGRSTDPYENTRSSWDSNYRETRGSGYGYAGRRIRRDNEW
ncbi:hypothetical protein [Flavihumibacter sp. ZG627]|uniref:hypothetical protein n=1 Tax=Flavihumibacter sp. ZG627 TaxID=1463156 RepID=UPI00057EC69E|nr:hypothetical protein [Flavihumibacter sp. ZG627]KIC92022.1 hypothetical protein HY58_00095 [Flavihumibacter sp. ZG627]